jgi:hypothetical protein
MANYCRAVTKSPRGTMAYLTPVVFIVEHYSIVTNPLLCYRIIQALSSSTTAVISNI